MNIAAIKIAGAAHNTAHGPTSRIGAADSNSSAHMRDGPASNRRGSDESNLTPDAHDGVLLEFAFLFRIVGAVMRSTAFFAGQCALCEDAAHRMHVAQFVIRSGRGRL